MSDGECVWVFVKLGIRHRQWGVEGKSRGTKGQGQFMEAPAVLAYLLREITDCQSRSKKRRFKINSCNISAGKARVCLICACTAEMGYFSGPCCGGNRLLGSSESLILLFWANLDDLNTWNITGLSSHLSIWGMSITTVKKNKTERLIMFISSNLSFFYMCMYSLGAQDSLRNFVVFQIWLYVCHGDTSFIPHGCIHTEFS